MVSWQQGVIVQHYHARCSRTQEERERSPTIRLKALHAAVKAALIALYAPAATPARALDLACGKGADVGSWHTAAAGGLAQYVGVDVVQRSVDEARRRHSGDPAAQFVCGDCFHPSLPSRIRRTPHSFDVCSCMFALHYSWSTEACARVALANVAGLLRPGGFFIGTIVDADVVLSRLRAAANRPEVGNRIYRIAFDKAHYAKAFRCTQEPFGIQYEFYLADAVDHCPEWLIPFDALKKLARDYGLELVLRRNFRDFVNDHLEVQNTNKLTHKVGAHGTMSNAEWECVSIYLVFAFQKNVIT